MTRFVPPPTAQEAVLAELRRMLSEGELRPGVSIRQETLAAELGVSRHPVREALKVLEGEGQIRYEPRRGYSVVELSPDDLDEIYRLRQILEAEAIALAAPRYTDEDIAVMRAAQADMAAAGDDVPAVCDANRRFHFALMARAEQPRLERLLSQLWDASDPYRARHFNDPRHRELALAEHESIIAAAEQRDPAQLSLRLDEHRSHAVPALKSALGAADVAP